METKRRCLASSAITTLIIIVTVVHADQESLKRQSFTPVNERIDCYPEASSKFSGYSKEACLARNCLFDDNPGIGVAQCYLSPNYGYHLEEVAQQVNGVLRFKLKRNKKVGAMFENPIDNVLLDVQYYTNDIIRFKLYDADSQRYEVGQVKS
jgi:hypothetical protein